MLSLDRDVRVQDRLGLPELVAEGLESRLRELPHSTRAVGNHGHAAQSRGGWMWALPLRAPFILT